MGSSTAADTVALSRGLHSMSSTTGHVSPNVGKYRISRRGRKLQISDDQRTLMALPKDVPERTWAEVLQKEENDLVCFEIREEILEEALRIGYEGYMERQTALFAVNCAAQAWLKLIDWHFYRHDPGEEPSAKPLCYIPKRAESWIPDSMPEPSPRDTWCRQDLRVLEECITDEQPPVCQSAESVQYPVVEDIPKEYWFTGKVNLYFDKEGNVCSYEQFMRESAPPEVNESESQDTVKVKDYDDEDSSRSLERYTGDDSEELQKVTDYTADDDLAKIHKPEMSSQANRRSSRLLRKRPEPSEQPAPDPLEISDISVILVTKPILEKLLEFIQEVENHTDPRQNQLGDDDPSTVEERKYAELREIYLKIVNDDMAKYLDLYKRKVESDGDVVVTRKILSNIVGMLTQTMMFLGRDIE